MEDYVRRHLKKILLSSAGLLSLAALVLGQGNGAPPGHALDGKRLFEDATFGGNGRTCETCHSGQTSTLSPEDVQKLFKHNPNDVLFIHDGSDDGLGGGTTRIRKDATILVTIPLPANVSIQGSNARSVVLRRGIPTLQNTPALDPVLMLDGRQPSLEAQAAGAIHDHAQAASPSQADLHAIAEYEKTNEFYSSPEMRRFALGGPAPELPAGHSASEKRGRRFFEDVPPNPADGFKPGLCAHCHSGPLLNQTNEFAKDFIGLPIPKGQRFISINVSEFNDLGNPIQHFVFDPGTPFEFHVDSPDPGRSLITGVSGAFDLFVHNDPTTLLLNLNAFKISQLRGIRNTAPYFHDNSAKTLEAVAAHYAKFFSFATGGAIVLTPQDQQDIVAFMKLLD
jgi:cytochrome c peroxidase